MSFFTEQLGFRLDVVFPADDPSVAVVSGHGVRLRLERGAHVPRGDCSRSRCPGVDGLGEAGVAMP
ncbi:MAG: hypothetical protein GY711_03860 [bacterium]|nr:hypothetical protein [bacterium]